MFAIRNLSALGAHAETSCEWWLTQESQHLGLYREWERYKRCCEHCGRGRLTDAPFFVNIHQTWQLYNQRISSKLGVFTRNADKHLWFMSGLFSIHSRINEQPIHDRPFRTVCLLWVGTGYHSWCWWYGDSFRCMTYRLTLDLTEHDFGWFSPKTWFVVWTSNLIYFRMFVMCRDSNRAWWRKCVLAWTTTSHVPKSLGCHRARRRASQAWLFWVGQWAA